MDAKGATGGSSSRGHDQAAPMDGGAAADSSSLGFPYTDDQYKKLVESVKPFLKSVARIFIVENNDVIGTGTAFLVSRKGKRSLFLTCQHNLPDPNENGIIRFSEDSKDYPIEKIVFFDEVRDILLFSALDVSQRPCVKFSTDKVGQFDDVVLVGYVSPTLDIKKTQKDSLKKDKTQMELVMVEKPSPLVGKIMGEPYKVVNDEVYEKMHYTCPSTQGVSGGPLFKNAKVVGMNLGADDGMRDGISINAVFQVLKVWLQVGNNGNLTWETLLELVHKNWTNLPKFQI